MYKKSTPDKDVKGYRREKDYGYLEDDGIIYAEASVNEGFVSSRRRHTRWNCDWSSDVCSSDLVAVIGGGNAGLEAVEDLFQYAEEIYLLEYSDTLKGDPQTQEAVKKNPKLKQIILNAQTLEVLGDKAVTGLKYKDRVSGEEKELALDGIFVEIGSVPNSEMVKGLVNLDKYGQVVIDSKYATTSHPGIFAAGDITDDPFKQNNISAGDAVKAALSAYNYL